MTLKHVKGQVIFRWFIDHKLLTVFGIVQQQLAYILDKQALYLLPYPRLVYQIELGKMAKLSIELF